jgi:hypothetical protein
MNLSGYTMVRNAVELDYPVDLTIRSLLHGCDDVTVGVADSTDDTYAWLHDLFGVEKRVQLLQQPWHAPSANVRWWVNWINETRKSVPGPQTLMLDADEVIDPAAFPALRAAPTGVVYTLKRLNYWRDVRTIIRSGYCCSDKVARFAPVDLHMTSDEIYRSQDFPEDEPEIRKRAVPRLDLHIHHLGFLRKREALFKKVEVCLRAFFGQGQDSRLVEAMRHPKRHWTEFVNQPVEAWRGPVPDVAKAWLKERDAL